MPFWSSKSKSGKSSSSKKKSNIVDDGPDTLPNALLPSDSWHNSALLPSSSQGINPNTLRGQFPTFTLGNAATKIRVSMLASAMIDALGGPGEFKPRFSYPWISSMQPNDNFNLAPGMWTDDTSMMLCLAHSLASYVDPEAHGAYVGGFDEVSQLEAYEKWYNNGYLSSTGKCFDIGSTTKQALQIFKRYENKEDALRWIRNELASEGQFSGNGSVMRLLPIGLAFWKDDERAKLYGRRSSQATHPSIICTEVCELWAGIISVVMQNTVDEEKLKEEEDDDPHRRFSKLSLLEYIAAFPFRNSTLYETLAIPFGVPPRPEGRADREQWFWKHHPLLRLIKDSQGVDARREGKFPYGIPTETELPSTGFAVHTVIAALYCFFTTRTFEEGALMAVNLGSDADTVGIVYAGLAAVWYGGEEGGRAEGVFWTKRVREWRKGLARRDLVELVAEELVTWERRIAEDDL